MPDVLIYTNGFDNCVVTGYYCELCYLSVTLHKINKLTWIRCFHVIPASRMV